MTYDGREASIHLGEPFELYLFQSQDQTFRLTSADESKSYLGNSYQPVAIHRSDLNQDQELRSGALTVTLPKNHALALLFVASLPVTPLSLTLYRRHQGDPEAETIVAFTGRVVKATFTDACQLECLPESEVLRRRIPGPLYQRQCNRVLYGTGCDVDRELFKTTATISAITQNGFRVKATAFGSQVDGWFDGGYIEKGFQRTMILRHIGQELDMITPMAALVVDDVVSAFPGCQRIYTVCVNKFNNGPRFFGFPGIPSKNPFDRVD